MKKNVWLIVILIVVFALLQIPSSDDYCNKIQIIKMGPLAYLNHLYFHWTGRLVTSFLAIVFFGQLPIENYNIVSFFNALCFLASLYFLSMLIVKEKIEYLWLSLILIFFIGARSHVAQFIYWPTGGIVYSFSYLIFFSTLWLLDRGKSSFFIILLVVFVSSFLIESINPALLVFLYALTKNEEKISKKVLLLLSFGTASCLLYFAPGNFNRATSSGGIGLSFLGIFKNYFYLIYKSVRYLWAPASLAVLSGFICTSLGLSFKDKILKGRWLFLVAGLCSISPFMLVPNQFNGRSSSLFVILFSIYSLLASFNFFKKKNIHLPEKYHRYLLIFPLVAVVVFMFDIVRINTVRNLFLVRNTYLQTKNGMFVEVRPLGRIPVSAHFDDVKSNKDHWINRCVAQYYKLSGLSLKSNEQ